MSGFKNRPVFGLAPTAFLHHAKPILALENEPIFGCTNASFLLVGAACFLAALRITLGTVGMRVARGLEKHVGVAAWNGRPPGRP